MDCSVVIIWWDGWPSMKMEREQAVQCCFIRNGKVAVPATLFLTQTPNFLSFIPDSRKHSCLADSRHTDL